MSAQELRKVLLRIALDGEFYNRMLVVPDEAIKDYELTDDEKKILTKPNIELLNKVGTADWFPPTFNVVIFAFIPVVVSEPSLMEVAAADKEKVTQLVRDIRNSVGPKRFDKIMQLVQQVQLEDQTRSGSGKGRRRKKAGVQQVQPEDQTGSEPPTHE